MEREKIFTTKNITVTAAMTAISFVLYMFVKFPLPFMFPQFLDIQFSELPAILTGFMAGPVFGSTVIVLKCLIKLPFTSTAGVGELGDLLMGIAYVVPPSIIYQKRRTKKAAVIGLIVGVFSEVIVSLIVNAFLLIPFYAKAFGWNAIIGMLSSLFPKISQKSFYLYYLPLSVLPFNILRLSICSLITFFAYKRLHRLINKMFARSLRKESAKAGENESEATDLNGLGVQSDNVITDENRNGSYVITTKKDDGSVEHESDTAYKDSAE